MQHTYLLLCWSNCSMLTIPIGCMLWLLARCVLVTLIVNANRWVLLFTFVGVFNAKFSRVTLVRLLKSVGWWNSHHQSRFQVWHNLLKNKIRSLPPPCCGFVWVWVFWWWWVSVCVWWWWVGGGRLCIQIICPVNVIRFCDQHKVIENLDPCFLFILCCYSLLCLMPSCSITVTAPVNFRIDVNRLFHLHSQSLLVSALGTKRLASEELANDWDNKRLNPGNDNYPLSVCICSPL